MAEARKIFLVACVARKLTEPAPAAKLYTSAWFAMARDLISKTGAPWFILSAKYGLVAPKTVIARYNETLSTLPAVDRREWADRVRRQMAERLPEADEVVILAGLRYRENLMPWLRGRFAKVTVPMEGLPIGRQLNWMKHATGL